MDDDRLERLFDSMVETGNEELRTDEDRREFATRTATRAKQIAIQIATAVTEHEGEMTALSTFAMGYVLVGLAMDIGEDDLLLGVKAAFRDFHRDLTEGDA